MNDRERDLERDDLDLDDPLGIAREPVTKDERIHASNDEDSVRRRRKRAGLGPELEDRSDGLGDLDTDPSGAIGTDLGSRDRH
jgi:hypothetical protein